MIGLDIPWWLVASGFVVAVLGRLIDPIVLLPGMAIGAMCRTKAQRIAGAVGWAIALTVLVLLLQGDRPRPYIESWFGVLASPIDGAIAVGLGVLLRWWLDRRRARPSG